MTRSASFDAAVLACRTGLRANAMKFTKDRDRAEDLVQDTILKALREHEMFRHDTNLMGWLFVMMRNIYLTQRRRDHRLVEDPDGGYAADLAIPAEQEAVIDLKDVHRCLMSVTPVYRESLLLAAEGISYSEIGRQVGANEGTIKSRVSRARAELRGWVA